MNLFRIIINNKIKLNYKIFNYLYFRSIQYFNYNYKLIKYNKSNHLFLNMINKRYYNINEDIKYIEFKFKFDKSLPNKRIMNLCNLINYIFSLKNNDLIKQIKNMEYRNNNEKYILKGISTNNTLSLSGKLMENQVLEEICENLKYFSNLSALYIDGDEITDEEIIEISEGLRHINNLEHLNIFCISFICK